MDKELIWLFGAVAAGFSALAAWSTYKKSIGEERAQLYLSLRPRFLDCRTAVKEEAFSTTFDLRKINEVKVQLQRYWYIAFDEWFSTNVLNNGRHSGLWNDYFKWAIANTLKYPAPVRVLEDMVAGEVSFGNYRGDFFRRYPN